MRDIKFLKQSLIAHRGIHNQNVKENTLLSFERAIKKNMIIEFDIQLTKDHKIIVFHDKSLKRMMGINKQINNLTYQEIQELSTYHIPLLTEVLNLVKGKVPLLIEIKPYHNKNILEKQVVELLDNYQGKFAIQSFSPLTIYWFKKHRNHYVRGQLATINYNYNFLSNIIYRYMLFNVINKPDFISYNVKGLPNKLIARKRKKDMIIGWTIRNYEELNNYKNYCDNFIVENIV